MRLRVKRPYHIKEHSEAQNERISLVKYIHIIQYKF